MSIPVSRVYTHVLKMPLMSKKELNAAVKLEVEQSVPIPTKNLYFDYEVTDTGDSENMLVRVVAAPKEIVDSYTAVCDALGLDLALVQTNIRADAQLCSLYEDTSPDHPYVIVDVGGDSIDVGILDSTLRVTGTVDKGGNNFTEAIAKELKISKTKAHSIKVTKGIATSKQQDKILVGIAPILDEVVKEIMRMNRFYEERVQEGLATSQILIVGGGANMPGLGDYLTNATRIACRVSSPWGAHISFGKLEPPEHADLPRFLTCAGLALAHDEQAVGK
jgi:type IV pilus assembly protein PilM